MAPDTDWHYVFKSPTSRTHICSFGTLRSHFFGCIIHCSLGRAGFSRLSALIYLGEVASSVVLLHLLGIAVSLFSIGYHCTFVPSSLLPSFCSRNASVLYIVLFPHTSTPPHIFCIFFLPFFVFILVFMDLRLNDCIGYE
ncbi:hypothetical protein K474DRAFT_1016917 [Panus rudis PR-1116 ss-1]|nr:hypothetical protein K474DRAFT_1016917 [Panus rudis PR-1116 ss-1]